MDIELAIKGTQALLDGGLAEIVNDEVAKDESTAISINQDQLLRGEKSDGKKTKKYKKDKTKFNPSYYFAVKKEGGGNAFPNRDYFNKGEMFGDMFVERVNKGVAFSSTDEKTRFLEKEEGVEMFGLNDKGAEEIINKNFDNIQKRIDNAIKTGRV